MRLFNKPQYYFSVIINFNSAEMHASPALQQYTFLIIKSLKVINYIHDHTIIEYKRGVINDLIPGKQAKKNFC